MSTEVASRNLSTADLVERLKDQLPGVRERAPLGDELRYLPAETFEVLRSAGVIRAMVPREHGGDDLPFSTLLDVPLCLGTADASAAWCATVMLHHSVIVGMFDPRAQAEVWADGPNVPIASSTLPTVTAEVVDGGYRLTGASPFSSCSTYAEWMLLAGMVPSESGPPNAFFFLVPAGDCTIDDTWRTTGMKGTGSNTVRTDGAFVPSHRAVRHIDLVNGDGPGSQVNADSKFRLPWVHGGIAFACTIIGAARGAYDVFVAATESRRGPGGMVRDLPTAQAATGRIAAQLDASVSIMRGLIALQDEEDPTSLIVRARALRDCALAAQLAVQAMEEMISASGTSAHMSGNPLERTARDIRMAAAHISLNYEFNTAHFGRLALEVEQPVRQPYF